MWLNALIFDQIENRGPYFLAKFFEQHLRMAKMTKKVANWPYLGRHILAENCDRIFGHKKGSIITRCTAAIP